MTQALNRPQAEPAHQCVNCRFEKTEWRESAEDEGAGVVMSYCKAQCVWVNIHRPRSCAFFTIAPTHPGIRNVERLLTQQGFLFAHVDLVGWKIFDARGVECTWLEYWIDPHANRFHMNVDKLRDGAANFAEVVKLWHGAHVDY